MVHLCRDYCLPVEGMRCLQRRIRNLPIVSVSLVLINVVVFLICIFTGDRLYYRGGLALFPVEYYQEYERLLWSMFLHDDTMHLCNNMVILLFLGSMLEKEVGHIWFTIVYFLSGLGGGILSLYEKFLTGSDAWSIGASGAVFGLDGLLLAMVLCWPRFRNVMSFPKVALIIGLSLYSGFMQENVDNMGHVGGLVVGFAVGLVICMLKNIGKNRKKREV